MRRIRMFRRNLAIFLVIGSLFLIMSCGNEEQNLKVDETEKPQVETVSGGAGKEQEEERQEIKEGASVEMEAGYSDPALPNHMTSTYFFGMNGEWVCDDIPGANGKKYFYRLVMQEDSGEAEHQNLIFSYAMEGEDYYTAWNGRIWCEEGTIDKGTFVCGYYLDTPDGERSGTIKLKHKGDKLTLQEGKGDAFFPFTNQSKETFYFLEFDGFVKN